MSETNYPRVAAWAKAMIIDSIVLIILIVTATQVLAGFDVVPDYVRMGVFVLVFFLYDPIFTSLFGCTIGHLVIGIRVKRESNPDKNLLFPLAIVRYAIKLGLGMVSLFTVMSDSKGKAIHDMVVGSVVIYAE
jgi:uncharacterized RDD family membrane protein YckC